MTPVAWVYDRTGFPYLPVPGHGFAVAVLPVTKAQAEVWLADPAGPGDDWYAEVLAVGPRAAWRPPGRVTPWHLLLTGVLPEEAARLAAWLGPEYRLPEPAEWRVADRALSALYPQDLFDPGGHPAVAGVVGKLRELGRTTAAELTLLAGGVLEWVARPTGPPGGLGRPAKELAANLILDPQGFDPVTLIRPGRHPAFGVRLVLDLGPGGAS
jgi:hypothetical protein